jgi:predicted regulator of Ras-like GTPase activity (Roadblock/LC7/MglB family)
MFGFLKNLLRKAPETSAENYESVVTETGEAPYAPQSAAKPPIFKAPPLRRNGSSANGNGKGIELSLQTIVQGLPLELQPRLRRPNVGDATITVPLEKVLAQLSRGAVKVSFGELRQAAPEVFTAQNDRDRVLVSLPLADILNKLNPALIARRRVQRQVEIPAEISSPFASHGEGLSLAISSPKAQAEAAPAPLPARQMNSGPPPIMAPPRGSMSSVAPPQPAETAPVAPTNRFSLPSTPTLPAPGMPPKASPPQTAPSVAPARPSIAFSPKPTLTRPTSPIDPSPVAMPPSPAPEPLSSAPVIPVIPVAAAPPSSSSAIPFPKPVVPSVPPARESAPSASGSGPAPVSQPGKASPFAEPLVVSLASLAEAWPEEVRKEIIGMGLAEAKVGLPANAIEQALKQGRICFSWKTIRSWVKPAVPAVTSNHDGAVLDLPLKIVAPLFLDRQRAAAVGKPKVSIDEEIPNLFFGFPQAEVTPAMAAATARSTDTNYYVWDDSHDTARIHESEVKRGPTPGTKFVAKYATPNEVVSRAAGLEGVAGALIALPDGLMVANRLPPDLNADTLAAFLPQIFGKVSQCTKELRMGDLNNLNFTVGNVPWKIFRVNAIFFAAFGQAGVPLPTAQLAALAAELDHKPK